MTATVAVASAAEGAAVVGMVGKALLSVSPSFYPAASILMLVLSWGSTTVQAWHCWQACLAASMVFLAALPFRQAALYTLLASMNAIDIDQYVSRGIQSFPNKAVSLYDRIKVAVLHSLSMGKHKRSLEATPLAVVPSSNMKGLSLSKRQEKGDLSLAESMQSSPLVVGTIRMGFGHHRIAYSTASWGLHAGANTLFHDLLSVESNEADLIKHADAMYSKGSRIASELGGAFERLWGSFTKSGDANALRTTYLLAENLRPLLLGLPKDTPIIATHSLVGLTAVACGFKNVINLVIDNYPQWFVIVPGALNLVQGPVNYHAFLRMGVPESELRIAGHWCPADMVRNVESDCAARKQRRENNLPVRLLIPVGGAGAQRKFVTSFLEALEGPIKKGEVQVFLNAGDHKHMFDSFATSLKKMGFSEAQYEIVDTMDGVYRFSEKLRSGEEPARPITVFAFKDYFPAVATTDVLARVTDVLCCKPSELAFYPVPKLMLRRVGDHEAASADRAAELGDGTKEVREVEEALAWVKLFGLRKGLLESMNDRIVSNAKIGIYDGCKVAVELAQSMAGKTRPEVLN